MEDDPLQAQMDAKAAEIQQLRLLQQRRRDQEVKQRSDLASALQAQLATLQAQFDLCQSALRLKDKELAAASHSLSAGRNAAVEKEAEISELKAKVSVAEEQLEVVREALECANQDAKGLREELKSTRNRLETAEKAAAEEAKSRSHHLFQLLADKDAALTAQTDELLSLRVEVQRGKDLLDQVSSLQSERQSLKAELAALRRSHESSKSPSVSEVNIDRLVEDRLRVMENHWLLTLQEKAEQIDAKEKTIRSLQFECQSLRQQLTHEQTLRGSETVAHKRESGYIKEKYEQELTHFRALSDQQFTAMQKNYETQVERLNQRIGELVRDNDRLCAAKCTEKRTDTATTDLDKLQRECEEQKTESQRLRLEVERWKSEGERVRTEAEKLRTEAERLRLLVDEKDRTIAAMKVIDMQNAQLQESRTATEKEELRTELDYATSRLRLLDLENARLQAELRETAEINKRASLSMDSPDMKGSLRRLWAPDYRSQVGQSADLKSLEQENAQLKEIIAEMRTEMEAIQMRIGAEKQAMSEKTADISRIAQQLQAAEDARDLAQSELEQQSAVYGISRIAQLKQEVVQLTVERDQLIDISASLRAELTLHEDGEVRNSANVVALQQALDAIAARTEKEKQMPPLQVLTAKRHKRQNPLPKYAEFEAVASEAPSSQLPKKNSERETHSQRQLRTQKRGRGGRQRIRNYNARGEEEEEEQAEFVL